MNNNHLAFSIGCSLIVIPSLLFSLGSPVDITPYIIIGAALVIGSFINDVLGE